jgi:glycosyltransferase involved in cell wall biosynthesis
MENLGVQTEAVVLKAGSSKLSFYITNFIKLRSVIKKYKIDIVIAHQQVPALIAGLLRKVNPFRLIYVRHNTDEDYRLNEKKARVFNSFINQLTPVKVAPSGVVRDFWVRHEKVGSGQVHRIDYGYNFSQYELPDMKEVAQIRESFPTSLLILSIARLVPAKRHKEMFTVIHKLANEGIDCRLLCLGSGPSEEELRREIERQKMQDFVYLLGRKENVFDYIAAADVFMHLSYSEASNSAVKEVGLCKKPVIVCKGVGDFEDYIVNTENGFLVDKEQPVTGSFHILKEIAEKTINQEIIGSKLFATVTTNFDINNVARAYQKLFEEIGFSPIS